MLVNLPIDQVGTMRRQDVAVLSGCPLVVSEIPDHTADFLGADGRISLLPVPALHASGFK